MQENEIFFREERDFLEEEFLRKWAAEERREGRRKNKKE